MTMNEKRALELFEDPTNPTMGELVRWFHTDCPDVVAGMKTCNHALDEYEVNPYHIEGSIWSHTMLVCKQAENDPKVLKLAALFHDVGKVDAREVIPYNQPKPNFNGNGHEESIIYDPKNEGKMKVMFRGHEGISFWKAIDHLNKLVLLGVISKEEMIEVLELVSLHGTLSNRIKDGSEFKPEKVVNMFTEHRKYANFVKMAKNDYNGRFFDDKGGSKAVAQKELGHTLYGIEVWKSNHKLKSPKSEKFPKLTVLIGLPASGKSTWLKENLVNEVVISKDNEVLIMGKELGLDENYTDIYKALTKEQHDETYNRAIEKFRKSVKERKDIVIDMTNMSKKSRKKWLSNLKDYRTEAKVFLAGESLLYARNLIRAQEENKHIPGHVYTNMKKSFLIPTWDEFDEIEYIFQGLS
jgi:predicted kinase